MFKQRVEIPVADFYSLRVRSIFKYFRSETLAFWMICFYLFLEYVRPQSIYPAIDILPWSQLAVIGAMLGCFFDKTIKWVPSTVNKLYLSFFLLVIISSIFSYNSEISFRYLENTYTWLLIYFLIINIVNSEKRLFIFICIFLLASFKLSLSLAITWARRGFAFEGWGLSGPPGFFQNSGELAIQMLVYWPIAFGFAKYLKAYVRKHTFYILMAMPVTAVMVILGASSRGGQVALLAQLFLLNYRYILRIKFLVGSAIIISVLWSFIPEEQKARFEIAGEDRTSIQRIMYWENGINMLNDHPFTGVGYFNYVNYYENYYPEDMLYQRAELPHNIFIQVGSELGYFGLIIYILIMLYVSLKTRKLYIRNIANNVDSVFTEILKYLNISLFGFIVAGQFVSVVYYPFMWIHLAFFVCLNHIYGDVKGVNNVR